MKTRIATGVTVVLLLLLALAAAACGGEETPPQPAATPTQPPVTEEAPEVTIMQWDAPPAMTIDTGKKYTANMKTEKGTMVFELFAEEAPKTVNNFVFLAEQGYYNGTTFHRVLGGFMAQGGDPTGTGRGGPGYRFEDEFSDKTHVAGALSMANAGANTNGSQFFITFVPVHQLDGKHTVFGQLIEGREVLDSITLRDPQANPQFEGDKIISLEIAAE